MQRAHAKRLPCGVYVGGSIALRQYPHRRDYVRDLVRRLDHVPQILPLAYREQARTRGEHSRNMVRILDGVVFPPGTAHVKRELCIAAMLHDIGHAMHGHASERAINAWLGHAGFSNDHHSARLMYHVSAAQEGVAPVYTTPCLTPLSDITLVNGRASPDLGVKSFVLEFVDDLENAIGDAGDLVRSKMASPLRLARHGGLRMAFRKQETPAVALDCLRHLGFDGSYASLNALSRAGSQARQYLDALRQDVAEARQSSAVIARADEIAASVMHDMCQRVAHENPGCGTQWLIDVVTTADLEHVP